MNKFHQYKEELYLELDKFHTWDENAKQEVIKLLEQRNITTVDGMMKFLFDYAFKCGIKHAIDSI